MGWPCRPADAKGSGPAARTGRGRPAATDDRWSAVISVEDLGEFGLIAAIREQLPPDSRLEVAAGDDAAVLRVPGGRVVATTDVLVEGTHFRREWSAPADVGIKAAAQNFADVAAMGAQPRTLLVGLACPPDLPAGWVLDMIRGMVSECRRAGASIAGGDVTAAGCVMLGITALGDLAGLQPITRTGTQPGDLVALAGPVGWSAAGLALLRAGQAGPGHDDGPAATGMAALVRAHLRPQPPYLAGPAAAAAGATAMIDVSDGLLQDLGHIAAASDVRMDITTASLLASEALLTASRLLGVPWQEWVLTGGEDHALAATFPAGAVLPAGWSVIGDVREGEGVRVNGQPRSGRGGWEHFR